MGEDRDSSSARALSASFQSPGPGLPDGAFIEGLRFNADGLIPAVAQDWLDGAVLMVAWMNREAIAHSLTSGEVHYWSRSRQELWHKGATSGHTQRLLGLRYDCDADVLLLTIEQTGNVACHTGGCCCSQRKVARSRGLSSSIGVGPGNRCHGISRPIAVTPESEGVPQFVQGGGLDGTGSLSWADLHHHLGLQVALPQARAPPPAAAQPGHGWPCRRAGEAAGAGCAPGPDPARSPARSAPALPSWPGPFPRPPARPGPSGRPAHLVLAGSTHTHQWSRRGQPWAVPLSWWR
jgi:phosphoribosyl-AMP cyclohydrolase